MFTRRQLLQLAALSTLGLVSTSVRAENFDVWPVDLKSLESIAHSLFGKHPLELSNRFQVAYYQPISGHQPTLIQNSKTPDRQFDIRGVEIHTAENGARVSIRVRNIFTTKVVLVLEGYEDRSRNVVAAYQFPNAVVNELVTWIRFGFGGSLYRVWALTETDTQVLCTYTNIKHAYACDGC